MYNNALTVSVVEEALKLSYGDNMAVIVVAKYFENVELYSSETIIAMRKLSGNAPEINPKGGKKMFARINT